MFCLLLMKASDHGGSTEDAGGVVKEVVSLLTLSEMLGTVPETVMWESQPAFFLLGHDISFLKPYLPLKKVRKHKDTD